MTVSALPPDPEEIGLSQDGKNPEEPWSGVRPAETLGVQYDLGNPNTCWAR